MPAFTALNLEPEENVEEEIDNTRELQVDDALKLLQAALKLHAQGPRFFDEAADAYNALFKCDIFKYPESKTEYDRAATQPDAQLSLEAAFPAGLPVTGAEGDGSGSSLPQALYLAYKNHGQFVLDRIRHRARTSKASDGSVFEEPVVLDDARTALDDFAAALDRDPSDAELWRRTARVAGFLRSARVSRYSLEAAIELDDDPAVVDVEPPSLAEGFAGEQLKKQLNVLSDDMALSHPIMKTYLARELPTPLKRYLDPSPFLPDPTASVAAPRSSSQDAIQPRLVISVPAASWADLGMALVRLYTEEGLPGAAVSVVLPDEPKPEAVEQMEIDKQLQGVEEPSATNELVDVPSPEQSPTKPTAETASPTEPKSAVTEPAPASEMPNKDRKISLPSRKRSQSTAGIPETADDDNGDTKRSKRIRRRETVIEEAVDPATLFATQLQPFQAADQYLFQTTKNILENLDVTDQVTMDRITEVLDTCASEDRTSKLSNPATADLRTSILSFHEDDAKILLNKKGTPQLSLSAFLEHNKSGTQRVVETPAFDEAEGLRDFAGRINTGWYTLHEVAYEFVKAIGPSYTMHKWSDQMKTAAVQVISRLDAPIYEEVLLELERSCSSPVGGNSVSSISPIIQMLFELHVDVYERITNPNSVVEYAVRMETKGRLYRWLDLAAKTSRQRPTAEDELALRYLWAATFSTTLSESISRDHILACWNSLRDYLLEVNHDVISLPNNAVIPEVSAKAAEREISKLTTMDFFLGIFQDDMGDPVAIIDTLEPVLNPESVYVDDGTAKDDINGETVDAKTHSPKESITARASQGLLDLWKFLESSSTELRLFLWTRLGEAYGKIKYTTKQFSCFVRSIEMVMADFESDLYLSTPNDARRTLFITMLKSLDDLLIQALSFALNDNSAFDIIDEAHLKSTSIAVAKLSCMLHVAAIYDDEVRVGVTQSSASSSTFNSFLTKLREMQVRTWSLLYTIFKVGIHQNKAVFPKPENDLADYLAAVHQVLGLRKCCKASNKIFLRMMRVELLKQQNIENWEDYLGQVLFDLHGLKLGVGIWEVQDHGCPPDKLERKQAMALVEKISILANRMPMKDLLKSDLKNTIDHMQQAIGSTKSTPQMIHNLRNFTEYLKKPIHPLRLYQALTGSVTLDAVTINTPESVLAKRGWFYMLGMIALTKFKGVDLNRRQTPGATDDLRMGATFLRLQLQFTPDRWDAWFRLAECFDYELDEAVLWTADKMNKERGELLKFQRNSIHCYTLALSNSRFITSGPSTISSEADEDALCELYHNFGMRLYASSREPFGMEPFQHADQERFFIESMGAGTFKKILHEQMTDYKVWKYAAGLFKRAMAGRPKDWKNPYMYGKCLWKMYQKPIEALDPTDATTRPTLKAVIKALETTIEVVSQLPKPRHGQDAILEPHYKILSVVYKLVSRGDLIPAEAAKILYRQPYGVQSDEEDTIENAEDWQTYAIKCLRHLRDKDKSNWQHRLIIRQARIVAENDSDVNTDGAAEGADGGDDGGKYLAAKAAFLILRESMFTKTMVMNVWKCDAERPGRHHVYTEQYIRFMVQLLSVMNDRVNMEAVLRRLRKKGADFYHFGDLWQACVVAYLKLLRQSYNIPITEEDPYKNLSPEEFDIVGEKVSDWVSSSEAQDHRGLAAMRDAVELKKLNASLMKAAPIDDLIFDCYAFIYNDLGTERLGLALPKAPDEPDKGPDVGMQVDGPVETKPSFLNGLLAPVDKERESMTLGSLRATPEQAEKMERQVSSTGDAAPRGRKAGVRRPDVLRKAEQAISRAAEGPPKSAGANGTSGRKSRLGSASSGKHDTPNDEPQDGNSEDGDGPRPEADDDVEMKDGDDGNEGGGGDRENEDAASEASLPRSLHDSADDESDLSDVPADYDSDGPPPLLFPNLRRSVEAGALESDADSTAEEEEEEEDEEEEEEEETQEVEEEGTGGPEENPEASLGEPSSRPGNGDKEEVEASTSLS